MREHVACVGLTALVIALAACARGGGEYDEFAPEVPDEITLEVQNQNFYDATLYAVSGTHRLRLGSVVGNGQGTFQFQWPQPRMQVEIDLIGVGSYLTDWISVDRGDILELRIEPDLDRTPPVRRRRP